METGKNIHIGSWIIKLHQLSCMSQVQLLLHFCTSLETKEQPFAWTSKSTYVQGTKNIYLLWILHLSIWSGTM